MNRNISSGRKILPLLSIILAISSIFLSIQSAQAYTPPATDRTKVQLNGTWKFIKSSSLTGAEVTNYNDSGWSSVSVPHSWNRMHDVHGSNGIADASNSWYRTHFTVPSSSAGKDVYISFEGVFQIADVYVNGVSLGEHRGGFTRFNLNATGAINFGGDNVLAVMVGNTDCSDCLPDGNARLWKGYGGIYRKVWVITTNNYHVSTTDFSSSGVYITPTNVSSNSANVSIKTMLTNQGTASKTFTVKNYLTDANENTILSLSQDVVVAAGASASSTQSGTVSNPHLWSTTNPYLYNVHAEIWVDGAVRDLVNEKTGFRYYSLSSSDFTLNGSSNRLRGVAKHQETEYSATAVSDADLTTDWDNLQDLGVNYVRLVHYPHAQLEYDLADQRGIMVWAEDGHTNSGIPTTNADTLVREMVFQNYNHPSIIFWSAGNEAGSTGASHYGSVIKASDSSRPVVYASNGGTQTNIDYIFHNTYDGWYGSNMYAFPSDSYHWISEEGAGMVIGTQNADYFNMNHTVDSYEPEQFGELVNEVLFQDLFTNPSHVPAFSEWIFRDMGDKKYKGYINSKGLLTYSNYKKDIYFLYKSFLKPNTRVIQIVGPHYFLRDANPGGHGDVKVYSNAPSLTLTINGSNKGTINNRNYHHPNGFLVDNTFLWTGVLSPGRNTITASDGSNSQTTTVYYKGSGTTMPTESGAAVTNLTSSNGSAYFINTPIADQRPFYFDFDSTGDNTFDVVPSAVSGASWITTKRQSDSNKTTNLAFDLASNADIYIMCTAQSSTPSWISSAGFSDTGASGKWRDNNLDLVSYKLYKKTFSSGSHVSLGSSAIDYVVLVKAGAVTSKTISNLSVQDSANAASWSIAANLQVGDAQYGDRTYTFTSVPSLLAGADWIRSANASKGFTGNPTVTFDLSQTADVYVGVDARDPALSWMSGWTNTGLTLQNNEATPSTFTLFKKSFGSGSVSLGPSTGAGSMYTVIVK